MDKTQRILIGIIASAFLLIILLVGTWWFLSERSRNQVKVTQAETGQTISKGDSRASQAATQAVADYGDRQGQRTQVNEENRHDIQSQTHYSDAVDPALHDAGIRSLCRRAVYSESEQCTRLRNSGTPSTSTAGQGSTPAGKEDSR